MAAMGPRATLAICAAALLTVGCASEALVAASATSESTSEKLQKNPIRKVVTMLQDMQKGVEKEGQKEKELFDKFMCYCSNGAGALEASISQGKAQVDSLTSQISEQTAMKSQLEQDVAQHKTDRETAEATIKESTAMREKEASEYAATAGEMKANIQAMDGALTALKKGLGAAMLQTGTADLLRNIIKNSPVVRDSERETLLSFLDTSSDAQAGGSDQIIGIVDQMKETMSGDLAEATKAEDEAKAAFATLTETKTKEIAAAGKAIESKTVRAGETAVSVTEAKADLEATEEAIAEDTKLQLSLAANCATKQKEWDARSKVRAEEIQAISETIEMLNGDDALDLFKKTLPSPGGAFLQVNTASQAKGRATALIRAALKRDPAHAVNLKMILMMLKAKTGGGFDKVVKMVDNMIAVLTKEQADDDKKKDYCHSELDKSADQEKALKGEVSDISADISEKEDTLATITSDIEGLQSGIAALDKMVAEATEQRKEEHVEYTAAMTSNSACQQLIEMAKNRLNKFYNPSLYKAPETTTESSSPYGFVEIAQHTHRRLSADLGEAPETFSGEYKKSEGSTGIIAMMSQMAKDVEMDTTEAKHDEEDAQKDYTETMQEAATKRSDDSKLIVQKEGAKSGLAEELATARELLNSKREQLNIAGDKLNDVHIQCDVFLSEFDEVKASRAKEMDGLKESKSVLAGAAPSL